MRLSRKGRYGVRAMVCLAMIGGDSPISTKRVAETEGIPVAFLEQLLFRLKKAGFVRSRRGPKGGFALTKRPEDIRMIDILEALDEAILPAECVAPESSRPGCSMKKRCASHLLWQRLSDTVRDVLEKTTLADVCSDARELQHA